MPIEPAKINHTGIILADGLQVLSSDRAETLKRFDQRLADGFVYKSISEATRRTYRKAIKDFFAFVNYIHPAQISSRHVIEYRDHLISKKKSANTIALKLSVIRSFYDYLVADGTVERNPASTKLVSSPPVSDTPSGRALTPKEVRHLLAGPDRLTPGGARDYALMLLMLRLSLRVTEACSARLSNIKWSHGRWVLTLKVKRGREEKWPIPSDVKQAIDDYLKLDYKRRAMLRVNAPDAYIFQPHTNYRTLEFAKPLSSRQAHKIVRRWAEYTGLGKVSPHDLRRTVITKLLNDGRSYREVQMVTKQRDPRSVQRYDHGRENLESNPVNTLTYSQPEDDEPNILAKKSS
jgi:site-specific recombinase XerD